MRNYNVNPPVWFKSLVAKKEKEKSFTSGSKRSSSSSNNQTKIKKILEENPNLDNACKLNTSKTFGAFFNRNALESLPALPKIQSTHLCLKYHVLGKCFSTCSRKCTHVNLENDKLIQLWKFVQEARIKSTSSTIGSIRDPRGNQLARSRILGKQSGNHTPDPGLSSQDETNWLNCCLTP